MCTIFVGLAIKSLIVNLSFNMLLACVLIPLLHAFEKYVPLVLTVAAFVIIAILVLIYPICIWPLTHGLKAIPNELNDKHGDLLKWVDEMAKKEKMKTPTVKMLEESNVSDKNVTAYGSGAGPSITIIISDNFLMHYETDQVKAIIYHELGHIKKKHSVIKALVLIVKILVLIALLGYAITLDAFKVSFGFRQDSVVISLFIFYAFFNPFLFYVDIFSKILSRQWEYTCDEFSADGGYKEPLIQAFKRMAIDQKAMVATNALYTALHNTHPLMTERIAALERYHGPKSWTRTLSSKIFGNKVISDGEIDSQRD